MNNKFVSIDSCVYKTFRDTFNTDFESAFSKIDKILENSYGLQYSHSEPNSYIYKAIDESKDTCLYNIQDISKFHLLLLQYPEYIKEII
jgi:hypothetical protein